MALPQLATLEEIDAAIWQQLARAPRDKHHEWRTPVLATVMSASPATATATDTATATATATADGADARTVVLREVDAAARRLVIYTDARSAKMSQLRLHPRATLVLWSSRLGWQLRCTLRCTVYDEGLEVTSRWARLKMSSAAQDYLSPLPPGSTLDTQARSAAPLERQSRDHFAVIAAEVQSIDWLELHAMGHRRALFEAQQAPRWLVP